MKPLVFGLPGNDRLATHLCENLPGDPGSVELRYFPDGELYLRVRTAVRERDVVLACTLDVPNEKLFSVYQLASTLRAQGAHRIVLAAPYLAYLRQDRAFQAGEAVTSRHTARWLSECLDGIVTVDPHLHRLHDLNEVYTIPTRALAAAPRIADWIGEHIGHAVLIGPDAESTQWVSSVAQRARCPFVVLDKVRSGDRSVEVSVPDLGEWPDRTPVLVDDIISTGRTLIAAIRSLPRATPQPPACIGVHAIFAGDAFEQLLAAGCAKVITTNTIAHATNAIDIHPLVTQGIVSVMDELSRAD